jgi:hypothetical protein
LWWWYSERRTAARPARWLKKEAIKKGRTRINERKKKERKKEEEKVLSYFVPGQQVEEKRDTSGPVSCHPDGQPSGPSKNKTRSHFCRLVFLKQENFNFF